MFELFINALLFLAGFLILIRGADTFIDNVAKLGRKLGMKPVLVGLSLVSFGTSFPELAIASFGAFRDSAGVSLGTVIGSNIANSGLFLGLAGFIGYLHVKKNIFTTETPLMIFSLVLLFFFMENDLFINDLEGLFLMMTFAVYIFYIFRKGMHDKKDPLLEELIEDTKSRKTAFKLFFFTIIGLSGLLIGSYVIVDTGIEIARIFGVNEAIIALTAMALGTSIPEVTSSLVALKKGEKEVAYGGIIGSITFNTLLIIGLTAQITPLSVPERMLQDGFFMILFGILMLPFAISGFKLTKFRSGIVLLLYGLWIISLFL